LLVDTVLADGSKVSELELWLTAHRVSHELELGMDPEGAVPKRLPDTQPDRGVDGAVDDPVDGAVDDCADGPADSSADGPCEEPVGDPFPVLVPEARSAST